MQQAIFLKHLAAHSHIATHKESALAEGTTLIAHTHKCSNRGLGVGAHPLGAWALLIERHIVATRRVDMGVALEELQVDLQEIGKGLLVVVDAHNDRCYTLGEGAVASVRHTLTLLHKSAQAHLGMLGSKCVDNGGSAVARVVVDNHQLPQTLVQSLSRQRAQGATQWLGTIVGGDDDREFRGATILCHNTLGISLLYKNYSANNPSTSSHTQSLGAGSKPRIWQTIR